MLWNLKVILSDLLLLKCEVINVMNLGSCVLVKEFTKTESRRK
jgi:chemotaxis receptor (MCP) glutamine deamidase CheD